MDEQKIVLQGTFLSVFKVGILLTGKPGIGKSELALALLDRKHQLIADDSPYFRIEAGKVFGFNPLPDHFLYNRSLGLLNIPQLFGADSTLFSHELHLILEFAESTTSYDCSLEPKQTLKDLSGCLIPIETIPIINPRNLEVLVEVIVKKHLLKINKEWSPVANFDDLLMGQIHS